MWYAGREIRSKRGRERDYRILWKNNQSNILSKNNQSSVTEKGDKKEKENDDLVYYHATDNDL